MKKLILSVAMLCATSMLFAQIQLQQEECADCKIEQLKTPMSGQFVGTNSTENRTTMNQTGFNTANVIQAGSGNESFVTQDGKNGAINGYGYGNTATVNQNGMNNEAEIGQHGDNNTTTVDQMGKFNYSYVDLGVGYAENNTTSITQSGKKGNNSAFQKVRYDNNWASIEQYKGGKNYAEQDQSSMANHVSGSDAFIYQWGCENEAKQVQRGSLNNAKSIQYGKSNKSVETQTSSTSNGSSDLNKSTITQTNHYTWADGNEACVEQNSLNGYINKSIVTQTSGANGGNFASVWQNAYASGNNGSVITQLGGNTAHVTQVNGVTFP